MSAIEGKDTSIVIDAESIKKLVEAGDITSAQAQAYSKQLYAEIRTAFPNDNLSGYQQEGTTARFAQDLASLNQDLVAARNETRRQDVAMGFTPQQRHLQLGTT
ncbi:MAG: hypothetical protein SFW65_01925 [Alphaproteobacteria bacterium]|nr:hypothetical protein [Alphaproteobacteria bacterium]